MYGSKNKYVLSQVNRQWTEKNIYSVWTCRDSIFLKKVIKYILWFWEKESWLKTQHFYLSTYQHNTGESPTSHPRINKGDLWQGRERKKRGKETSDPSPARKYRQTADWERSCPSTSAKTIHSYDDFHSHKKEGGGMNRCQLNLNQENSTHLDQDFHSSETTVQYTLQELVIQKVTTPCNIDSWC